MSPEQLKKLQELSLVFSQGIANPQQIQQLSTLLAQINRCEEKEFEINAPESFIAQPRFGF